MRDGTLCSSEDKAQRAASSRHSRNDDLAAALLPLLAVVVKVVLRAGVVGGEAVAVVCKAGK